MMKTLVTIIIIITLGLISCSTTRGPYVYEICVPQGGDSSVIAKNEILGLADTTVSFLSGQVVDLYTKESVGFAYVILKDTGTNKVYEQLTDSLGKFLLILPPNNYVLEIKFIGYTPIKKELKLGTGEMRKMKIELGKGSAFVTYEIKSNKKLNKRQLIREVKKLEK